MLIEEGPLATGVLAERLVEGRPDATAQDDAEELLGLRIRTVVARQVESGYVPRGIDVFWAEPRAEGRELTLTVLSSGAFPGTPTILGLEGPVLPGVGWEDVAVGRVWEGCSIAPSRAVFETTRRKSKTVLGIRVVWTFIYKSLLGGWHSHF